MRGMSKKRIRSDAPGSSRSRRSSTSSRPTPSRAAAPIVQSSRMARGSRHWGSEAAMSPPTMKVSWSSGRASWSLLRVSTVNERPGTSASARETPSRSSPATAASHSADAHARRPGRRRPPCAAACAPARSSTRSSPSCDARLLRADQVADVRRVERPAEQARSAARRPDLAVALDQVLERAQLARADRPAGVQLLGRVADLGAHPELAAVGEARRGVDVHAGGVDAELERPRGRACRA